MAALLAVAMRLEGDSGRMLEWVSGTWEDFPSEVLLHIHCEKHEKL